MKIPNYVQRKIERKKGGERLNERTKGENPQNFYSLFTANNNNYSIQQLENAAAFNSCCILP